MRSNKMKGSLVLPFCDFEKDSAKKDYVQGNCEVGQDENRIALSFGWFFEL